MTLFKLGLFLSRETQNDITMTKRLNYVNVDPFISLVTELPIIQQHTIMQ